MAQKDLGVVTAYGEWLAEGNSGTKADFLASLKGLDGSDGDSAYNAAVRHGFSGSEEDWLESLKGLDGGDGDSAYEVAIQNGFVGSEEDWLESLKGEQGNPGSVVGLPSDGTGGDFLRKASDEAFDTEWVGEISKTSLSSDVRLSLDKADGAIPLLHKGMAGGVATLDGTGKVPASQLPSMGGSGGEGVGEETDPVFESVRDSLATKSGLLDAINEHDSDLSAHGSLLVAIDGITDEGTGLLKQAKDYTDDQIAGISSGGGSGGPGDGVAVEEAIDDHNVALDAHEDIRGALSGLADGLANEVSDRQQADSDLHDLITSITSGGGGYVPPQGGIPLGDLSQGVQDSLGLADSALQSETDPVYTADKDLLALKTDLPDVSSFVTQGDIDSAVAGEASAREDADTALAGSISSLNSALSNHESSSTAHTDIRDILNDLSELPVYNSSTHVITFTAHSGQTLVVDLPLEGLAKGIDYDPSTKEIILTKEDDSEIRVSVVDLVDEYTGLSNAHIQVTIINNEIEAVLLNGSIGEESLSPSLLAKINGKVDKVAGGVSGNFAGLDANGNVTDSGKSASDFATAAQGAKADSAYQLSSNGIPSSDLASEVQVSLGKADTALQSLSVGSVTTGSAPDVQVSGDPLNPSLDFVFPAGEGLNIFESQLDAETFALANSGKIAFYPEGR